MSTAGDNHYWQCDTQPPPPKHNPNPDPEPTCDSRGQDHTDHHGGGCDGALLGHLIGAGPGLLGIGGEHGLALDLSVDLHAHVGLGDFGVHDFGHDGAYG